MVTLFKVGELVRVRQNARTTMPGVHEVVAVIEASSSRERLYRVRGGQTTGERTVEEKQLVRA